MTRHRSSDAVAKEREEFDIADANIRRQNAAYEHQRYIDQQTEIAEWRRVTGVRVGNQDEPGTQVRRLLAAHAALGRKVAIKIVQLEQVRFGRPLTVLEMWQALQPTDNDIKAGWKLPDRGATVSDVLPGCEAPETEDAETSRQRQKDDWANWNGDDA